MYLRGLRIPFFLVDDGDGASEGRFWVRRTGLRLELEVLDERLELLCSGPQDFYPRIAWRMKVAILLQDTRFYMKNSCRRLDSTVFRFLESYVLSGNSIGCSFINLLLVTMLPAILRR